MPGFRLSNEDGGQTEFTASIEPFRTHEETRPAFDDRNLDRPAHTAFLDEGILVVENLRGLDTLQGSPFRFYVIAGEKAPSLRAGMNRRHQLKTSKSAGLRGLGTYQWLSDAARPRSYRDNRTNSDTSDRSPLVPHRETSGTDVKQPSTSESADARPKPRGNDGNGRVTDRSNSHLAWPASRRCADLKLPTQPPAVWLWRWESSPFRAGRMSSPADQGNRRGRDAGASLRGTHAGHGQLSGGIPAVFAACSQAVPLVGHSPYRYTSTNSPSTNASARNTPPSVNPTFSRTRCEADGLRRLRAGWRPLQRVSWLVVRLARSRVGVRRRS